MTREQFLPRFALEYLQRHPEVTIRYAKRQARLRWRTRQLEAKKRKITESIMKGLE